jgi:hypothetical protein
LPTSIIRHDENPYSLLSIVKFENQEHGFSLISRDALMALPLTFKDLRAKGCMVLIVVGVV